MRIDIQVHKAIFFDAAGTLLRLTKSVGQHYALVGKMQGLALDATELDLAFVRVWRQMPGRPATGQPREDDDKGWWRELIERVLDRISAKVDSIDRDNFFEAAYGHFAEPGAWELFPEVIDVLETLAPCFQLAVISNFDGRLRMILKHLSVSKYFRYVFISSELGADKPDPLIYRRALEAGGFAPNEVLHVGDDPVRDWAAANVAGIEVFRLIRPNNSLRDLLTFLRVEANYRKN